MVRKLIHLVTKVLVPIPIFFRRGKTWSVWIFLVYLRICTLFKRIQFLFLQAVETKTNHSLNKKGNKREANGMEKKGSFKWWSIMEKQVHCVRWRCGTRCTLRNPTLYDTIPNAMLFTPNTTQRCPKPNQKKSCLFFFVINYEKKWKLSIVMENSNLGSHIPSTTVTHACCLFKTLEPSAYKALSNSFFSRHNSVLLTSN